MARTEAERFSQLLRGQVAGDENLRAAQDMLHLLMDSLASAVFWKDTESQYLGCNRAFAEYAGYAVEDLVGQGDEAMPWSEQAPGYHDWDRQVLSEGTPRFDIVEQLRSADGVLRWLSTNKVPIRDPDTHDVIGVLGSFREITETVRAQESLLEALAELDQRVIERTDELARANAGLRREVQERARLEAEERRLREEADGMRAIVTAMTKSLDLDNVVDQVVTGINMFIPNDLISVVLVSKTSVFTIHRLEASSDYQPLIDVEDLHSIDALAVPDEIESMILDEAACRAGTTFGPASSSLAVPMRTGRRLVGFIVLESRLVDLYRSEHGDRLAAIADMAAAHILNIELGSDLALAAAAQERERLARELHDSAIQTLAAAAMSLEAELLRIDTDDPVRPAFERISSLANAARAELRTLLTEMRPGEFDSADLVQLIRGHVLDIQTLGDIEIDADLHDVGVSGAQAVALFRITQEALSNVRRHSRASEVAVALVDDDGVRLTVRDNGIGFDPADVPNTRMGLSIMAGRASDCGLSLRVDSEIGVGTTVEVSLPRP